MNNYYSVQNKLYTLTKPQVQELNSLFPNKEDNWNDYLEWIEQNGKLIGECETLTY